MQILCCPAKSDYTSGRIVPHPRTLECLALARESGHEVDVIDVTGDIYGYGRALLDHWAGDLIIVEHDIVFTAEQLASFEECPKPWCLFAYEHKTVPGGIIGSIGFVRFRAVVTQKVPVDQIPDTHDGTIRWDLLDGRLRCASTRFGFRQHLHNGLVEHHHL